MHPNASDLFHTILSTSRDFFTAQGVELPQPVVDGGGPSSTFCGAVFGGALLAMPSWGAHVAVRIPDATYRLNRCGMVGPHLGIFRQLFFSLPQPLLGERDPETLVRALLDQVMQTVLGQREDLLFRTYQWHANSTRMTGEAKEVNLASGPIKGMEIAQLNRIDQVGGIKLEHPVTLIVIGVDRLTYALSLCDYYKNDQEIESVAGFYRAQADHAQALERLHDHILYAKEIQSDLMGRLDEALDRLQNSLNSKALVDSDTLTLFRTTNIVLETLFMTCCISGELRQSYIGQIGDLAKRIAQAMLNHPQQSRALVTLATAASDRDAIKQTEQMLLSYTLESANSITRLSDTAQVVEPLPKRVCQWHAHHIASAIDDDLLNQLSDGELNGLRAWILENYDDPAAAVRLNATTLPVGFAAIKIVEERSVIEKDLATSPQRLQHRLDQIKLVGVNGKGRRERLCNLFSVLQRSQVSVPAGFLELLPYLGVETLFSSARIYERSIPEITESWFERYLPHLLEPYRALSRRKPPTEASAQPCWAAFRVEMVARYLLMRAVLHKPLWQDPYGARYIIKRELLPLWSHTPLPQPVLAELIETALQNIDAPQEAVVKVRSYLLDKLVS